MKILLGLLPALLVLAAIDVEPDLGRRLAKWRPVTMPLDITAINVDERRIVLKLADACQRLERMHWKRTSRSGSSRIGQFRHS